MQCRIGALPGMSIGMDGQGTSIILRGKYPPSLQVLA